MDEKTSPDAVLPEEERESYDPPELTALGTVSEITRANESSPLDAVVG